ncbi:glycosyl transferase family 90 [Mucilaginibacter yixingensis]|uniref:Glycosyl transferase family 90 n=1 Tax=Mucilaginibacter yixingensis TaxID=1295612 RepID=A0A2T5JBZ0_9SPHI|nr:glycosyl transferase family 90 [Mucilaginibacter yixingensis]PTQ99287.1 glycosyl transferase family 90 [Mucilaginibacter yixingensis]
MAFRKLRTTIRRSKIGYYAINYLRQAIPVGLYSGALQRKLTAINRYDKADLADRVNYYNKLNKRTQPGENAIALKNMEIFKSPKTYNFDTFEYTRYFDQNFKASFVFGDAIHTFPEPSIQKSRPIEGDNRNAVLLKLDKKRHFIFIKDHIKFEDKKNLLIGRGAMTQAHRMRFMEMYFNHPLCDVGQVNTRGGKPEWIKPKISIEEHLQYKFILSLEGNDVATNLKWIMSSNSVAVMPKPKYETWFMEGRLIAGTHYIEIKDDYSDLESQLQYYIAHPDQTQAIARNANQYVSQFFDRRREDLISLLVLQKYFYYTSQTDQPVQL